MPQESGVMPQRLRLGADFRIAKVSARLSARRIWGCLILFFCVVAGSAWLVVWLLMVVFSFFFSDVWLVAAFSFLTTSGDAPGKQASVFVRVDILQEFRVLAGIRGRNAHRGQQPPKYDHTVKVEEAEEVN